MLRAGVGLTRVRTEDLKRALAALHRGELAAPITIQGLTRFGLQHCSQELLETLRSLDETATRAVLVAVLAERLARRDEP
jgi:hypothetical protein